MLTPALVFLYLYKSIAERESANSETEMIASYMVTHPDIHLPPELNPA